MVAFQTPDGQRVDFLGINNPTAPTDNHREFMSVLYATGESASADVPFVGKLGAHEFVNLGAQQTKFGLALAHRMGVIKAGETLLHLTKQTLPTALSSTAYQRYWTGIVEVGGTGSKFTFVPTREENHAPGFHAGPRHLTDEWKNRQVRGDIEFQLFWIPFLSEEKTPTNALTQPWQEDHKQLVGMVVFPQTDLDSEDGRLWAILATEMGANGAVGGRSVLACKVHGQHARMADRPGPTARLKRSCLQPQRAPRLRAAHWQRLGRLLEPRRYLGD